MYVSNQARLRSYRKERASEEKNSDKQQLRVYEEIATRLGDIESASNMARMAGRVFESVSQQPETMGNIGKVLSIGYDKLLSSIKNGSLDQFMKAMAQAPAKGPTQELVQTVIAAKDYKDRVNEALSKIPPSEVKSEPKRVLNTLISELVNSKLFQQRAREGGTSEALEEKGPVEQATEAVTELAASTPAPVAAMVHDSESVAIIKKLANKQYEDLVSTLKSDTHKYQGTTVATIGNLGSDKAPRGIYVMASININANNESYPLITLAESKYKALLSLKSPFTQSATELKITNRGDNPVFTDIDLKKDQPSLNKLLKEKLPGALTSIELLLSPY
jgi:hypothetical protein